MFTKNHERLVDGDIAEAFFRAELKQARQRNLLSDEHFTVDGALLEAGASLKSFQRKDGKPTAPPDDPGNATLGFHGEKRSNQTHESRTDPECQAGAQRKRQESQAELQRESAGREPQRADRENRAVRGQRDRRRRSRAGDAGTDSGHETSNRGRGQGKRHSGFRGRAQELKGHAAHGPKPGAARWECDRCSYHTAPWICRQSEEKEAYRRVFRMAEDDRAEAEGSALWNIQGAVGLHLCRDLPTTWSACGICRARDVSQRQAAPAWSGKGFASRSGCNQNSPLTHNHRETWTAFLSRAVVFLQAC